MLGHARRALNCVRLILAEEPFSSKQCKMCDRKAKAAVFAIHCFRCILRAYRALNRFEIVNFCVLQLFVLTLLETLHTFYLRTQSWWMGVIQKHLLQHTVQYPCSQTPASTNPRLRAPPTHCRRGNGPQRAPMPLCVGRPQRAPHCSRTTLRLDVIGHTV